SGTCSQPTKRPMSCKMSSSGSGGIARNGGGWGSWSHTSSPLSGMARFNRSRPRRRCHDGREALWPSPPLCSPARAWARGPAEQLMRAEELGATVERALADMPEKRRAICALRWTDGLTYAEIAARLGIAEKTVENQIGLGLRLLHERVDELRR